MEKLVALFNTQDGLAGLVASVCVVLTFQLFFRVFEFLWKLRREKEQLSEKTIKELIEAMKKNTDAITRLEADVVKLRETFGEFPKIKLDLRRLYHAIKLVAGEEWSEVRDEILKDPDLKEF